MGVLIGSVCTFFFLELLHINKDNYLPTYTNGSIVLGQEYDGKADKEDFEPIFDPLQSFSGKISQVEIWNIILTPKEIQRLANCHVSTTKSQNRVLTWKPEEWKLSGKTTITDIPLTELCQTNIALNQMIWPNAITFEKLSSYCNLVEGIPPLLYMNSQTKEVYTRVKEIFLLVNKTNPDGFLDNTRRVGIRCFTSKTNSDLDFWLGIKWNEVERKWYSPFKPSEDFPFKAKLHDVGFNCGYLYKNSFYNTPCERKFPCGICKVPHNKFIYLKGLCKYGYDIFDKKYYVYALKNNRPYFK